MKIKVDVTDPNHIFVHKGGRRKNHTYVVFAADMQRDTVHAKRVQFMNSHRENFIVPNGK